MKKKFICILLTVLLLSNTNQTLLAKESTKFNMEAEQLKTLGVFQGTDKGFELERQPQRLEGLAMLIRLLGKEAEAEALKGEPCFFTDVPNWGRGYVNYAYKAGLTVGVGGKLFGYSDLMNAQSYVTFMLRVLGYNDVNGDFSYKDALNYGLEVGLLTQSDICELTENIFLRDHIAKVSMNTLYTNIKDNKITLLDKLVMDGSISKEKADVLNKEDANISDSNTTNSGISEQNTDGANNETDMNESGESATDVDPNTTDNNNAYQEYQDKLMKKYISFNTSNYKITINEINIDNSEADYSIDVKLYFDKQNLASFMSMKSNEWGQVVEKLVELGSGIADESNLDVKVYLIFRDTYNAYPSQYVHNELYSEPVTKNSSDLYKVNYPYIRITFVTKTFAYDIKMGN